jgi:hypothetical protein
MANFRLSIFYLSNDNEGWTENYYWNGTNLTGAQTQLDSLIGQRVPMLCNHFKIVDGRASDVTLRGAVLFTTISMPQVGTYVLTGTNEPLEANTAIVQRFNAIAPRYAKIYLRGLSSDVIKGREKAVAAGWDAAHSIWTATILGGSFQARHRLTPPPHATYSYSTISADGGILVSARKPGRPFDLLVGRRTHLK